MLDLGFRGSRAMDVGLRVWGSGFDYMASRCQVFGFLACCSTA